MPRGREVKKNTKGRQTVYWARDRALFKLQLTLRDFRKLCILKVSCLVELISSKPFSHKVLTGFSFFFHL